MYTSPKEVEITRNADLINSEYHAAFKERYKIEPFIESQDLPIFLFLSKNFGLEKGSEIVRHYLKMNDDWFLKQAHTLSTLRRSITRVIADLGLRNRNSNSGLWISTPMTCDRCFNSFTWIGNSENLDGPRICQGCKDGTSQKAAIKDFYFSTKRPLTKEIPREE